jgi:hypothetical protein
MRGALSLSEKRERGAPDLCLPIFGGRTDSNTAGTTKNAASRYKSSIFGQSNCAWGAVTLSKAHLLCLLTGVDGVDGIWDCLGSSILKGK